MKSVTFILLIVYTTTHAQLTTYELTSVDFHNFLASKKIIAIGEMHGTREVPLFVLKLAQQLEKENKPLTVALEIGSNYQQVMDEFITNGDFEKLTQLDDFTYPDGRSSIAMGELIKGLREIRTLKILCFDIPAGTSPSLNRDSLMAVNLIKNYQGEQMIILTGNLHANLKEGYWKPGFKSAVFYLNEIAQINDQLLSLNTCFGGGTIWNCMQDGCHEREAPSNAELKQHAATNYMGVYAKAHPSGYSGYIYFDNVTASRPLVE